MDEKKTVLVVEDEELLAIVYEDTLGKSGYNVLVAKDGATAFKYLDSEKIDLVILDVKLPDTSGLKVLEEIRKKSKSLPVMMCTAYDGFKTDYEIWASHVSDFAQKPILLDKLRGKIKEILG